MLLVGGLPWLQVLSLQWANDAVCQDGSYGLMFWFVTVYSWLFPLVGSVLFLSIGRYYLWVLLCWVGLFPPLCFGRVWFVSRFRLVVCTYFFF